MNEKFSLKAIIGTILFSLFAGFLFFRTILGFYYGFKYQDNSTDSIYISEKEKEIAINSALVVETFNNIKFNNCQNLLAKIFYNNKKQELTELTNDDILAITYFYFSKECEELTISDNEKNEALIKIFNIPNIIFRSNSTFIVTNNFDNTLTISPISCECETRNIHKKIVKATVADDKLYIYEKFGIEVVDDAGSSIFSDYALNEIIKNGSFSSFGELATYKWTFKKDTNNNYYFVSIERI